jgi:hypothetical protein
MKNTYKRINMSFTFEDCRQLEELCTLFREKPTATVRRCIATMFQNLKNEMGKENSQCG